MGMAARDLKLGYGKRLVLSGISFQVAPGEIIGLLGPNGAGKSTLLRALSHLLQPQSGVVTLDDQPLESVPDLAKRLAAVSASEQIDDPFLTLRDYVALGRAPHLDWWGTLAPQDESAIRQAMILTDSLELADRPLQQLSSGERQRAQLARALAQDPQILLLDEPTSHLDVRHQIDLMTRLAKVCLQGVSVVAALHDLNLAARYCHRLGLVHQGQLLALGPARDVMTAENLTQVYGTPWEVLTHEGHVIAVPGGMPPSPPPATAVPPAPSDEIAPPPSVPPPGNPLVEIRQVIKTLGKKVPVEALSGVDLVIRSGEFVAITGPSGSGKTTLLYLMGALDRPTAGDVLIEGLSTAKMNEQALARLRRDKIGFVFQHHFLLPELSALENVALPLVTAGTLPKQAYVRAQELLDVVGLSRRTEHRPGELSGGEQQRVAIARALAARPPLLLGDEPTGNLDTANSRHIFSLLRHFQQAGHTVIVVTHDPHLASLADRQVTLVDGKLVSS